MLEGTKRLFPTDYQAFKEAMLEAAEEDTLPVLLEMKETCNFTLNDFQDLFYEFNLDTGLEITGHFFVCEDCGKLHVTIEVDYPEVDEDRILQ